MKENFALERTRLPWTLHVNCVLSKRWRHEPKDFESGHEKDECGI